MGETGVQESMRGGWGKGEGGEDGDGGKVGEGRREMGRGCMP